MSTIVLDIKMHWSLLGLDEAVGLLPVLVDQRHRRWQIGLLGLDVTEAELEQPRQHDEQKRRANNEDVIIWS